MITVTVLYPNETNASFDNDYYMDKHLPMVRERLAPALESVKVEFGISGGAPDTPAPFVALGHLQFTSLDDFSAAFAPHAEEILADVPNYTSIAPVFQISQVQ